MEFLIIAFIIMTILSSLTRNRKRNIKKEAPFDPWSFGFDSEPSNEGTEESPGEPEEEFVEEEPESEASITTTREPLPETFPGEELVKEAEFIPYVERKEEMIITPVPEEKRKTAEIGETRNLEEELKVLLTGRRLPLAIVASEVLGPPRAKTPFYYRSSRTTRKHS
jgi:hypothetical protein